MNSMLTYPGEQCLEATLWDPQGPSDTMKFNCKWLVGKRDIVA